MKQFLIEQKQIIDSEIEKIILDHFKDPELKEMISYAFFPGGKRLRPIIATEINEILGGSITTVINSACALELFHVATLLLDDLPCMDDDDYRRGKLSFHKKFGEANATLVSFGLCKKAFEVLATEVTSNNIDQFNALNLIKQSAIHMGLDGVIGGQKVDLDMQEENHCIKNNFETLDYIVKNKTAKLFGLSAIVGTSFTNASEIEKNAFIEYANNFGYAFQILDDLLTPDESNPLTFYKFYGHNASLKILKDKINTAIKLIEPFGNKANNLKLLALNILEKAEKPQDTKKEIKQVLF